MHRPRSDSLSEAETLKLRRPKKRIVPSSGLPSGPWVFGLILLGGIATFVAFMIGRVVFHDETVSPGLQLIQRSQVGSRSSGETR